MPDVHTVKSFDDDLRHLRALISQMGGLAETSITQAMTALIQSDSDLASRVIQADLQIDQLEQDVEKFAIQLIARRAPLADDLRNIVSALKISSLIERIGDYSKNIAKRTTVLATMHRVQPVVIVAEMGRLAAQMLGDVLDSYAARDVPRALRVWEADQQLDDLYNSLFRSLLTYMAEQPQQITPSAHLLFIAKNIERIGDHATNIAEIIHFIVTGEFIDSIRPKADETPYVANSGDEEPSAS
jgi:phosphate transport system protein